MSLLNDYTINSAHDGRIPAAMLVNGKNASSNDLGKFNKFDTNDADIADVPGQKQAVEPQAGDDAASVVTHDYETTLNHARSRFNPLFRLSAGNGATQILSLMQFAANRAQLEPTIANLLNPSQVLGITGASNAAPAGLRYNVADFLYCANANEVSGYHMITLRRFSYPCTDNIWMRGKGGGGVRRDVGRLVTYTTEETNKLSDLLTMNFGLNWKELTADFWQPQVIGSEWGHSGLLGSLMKFSNPVWMKSKGLAANALQVDPHHDQNKVYGPVDSITRTHIRDRGLNFEQEFNIEFNYDLKSFNGIDGRTAMIDLLSNILVCTFNDARFWPGAIHWRNAIQRSAANKYMSASSALRLGQDFQSTLAYYKTEVKSLLGNPNGLVDTVLSLGKLLLKGLEGFVMDKLTSTLGRPSVMVANSLLSGEPIGEWHLTIGNPFRPIMSIGNLILTNTQIQFGDVLGHDGFPTSFKVVCTLKHGKPRSRAEIETMFNGGMQRTYWMPSKAELDNVLKSDALGMAYKHTETDEMLAELSNEIYTFMDNPKTKNFADSQSRYTNKDYDTEGSEYNAFKDMSVKLTEDSKSDGNS